MLCTDLILPVMIVLSGITLTLGFPAENRLKSCTDKYLEPIIIKVNIVIAKLYESEKELEMFYPWSNQLPLPNNKSSSRFESSNCRKLKANVIQLRRDIREISKKLKYLISLEMSPNFKKHRTGGGRMKLLKELIAEINNLKVELSLYKKVRNKNSKKSLTRRMPKVVASGNLSYIKSQTELEIEEWRLLKTLKMILVNWSKNFNISGIPAGGSCEICVARIRHSSGVLKFL